MGWLLAEIFSVGVALNVLWEFSHCWLYETCRRQSWRQNAPQLLTMALKDGFLIVLFYIVVALLFGVVDILQSPAATGVFVLLAAGFSFVDETISVRHGRWEYAAAMPMVFGVGLTPLLEIAATGVLTFFICLRWGIWR